MGDERVIAIRIQADGTAEVVSQLGDVSKKTGDIGDKAEKAGITGEGGFRTLGFASARLGESLGIPFRASHVLGTQVERLAQNTFPSFGLALGGVAVALAAGVMIWQHTIAATQKHREEIIKGIDTAEAWIKTAYGQQAQTEKMIKITEALTEAERKQNLQRLQQGVGEKQRLLQEEEATVVKLAKTYDTYNNQIEVAKTQGSIMLPLMEKQQEMRRQELATKQADIPVQILTISKMKEEIAVLQQKAGILAKQKQANDQAMAYENAYIAHLKALQVPIQKLHQEELKRFDQETKAHAAMIEKKDERESYYATRQVERSTLEMQQEEAARQQRLQNEQTMWGGMATLMGQAYELSGNRMKVFFYAQRAMAAAEAYIMYTLAAANVSGQLGIFGIPMASYFTAMSYIAPAMIMAQTLMGPSAGGGGGGATGTFEANPNTGLPTSTSAQNQPTEAGPVTNNYYYGTVIGDLTSAARALVPHINQALADGAY